MLAFILRYHHQFVNYYQYSLKQETLDYKYKKNIVEPHYIILSVQKFINLCTSYRPLSIPKWTGG